MDMPLKYLLRDVTPGLICFTRERMDDDEIRETFYLRLLGEHPPRYLYNVHIARLGIVQGVPNTPPRYFRVCDLPCIDPGEAHGLTPVYTMRHDSEWWASIREFLERASFAC
jgi:hypothetical protein